MAFLITVFNAETGTTTDLSFARSPIRIGRAPGNEVVLPFPFVSGAHAVVQFDGTQARFTDLGSTNGSFFNGRKIAANESLPIGNELCVTIGSLELRMRRAHEAVHGFSGPQPPPLLGMDGPTGPSLVATGVDPRLAGPFSAGNTSRMAARPELLDTAALSTASLANLVTTAGTLSDSVRRLALSLRPQKPPPATEAEMQRFLESVQDVLLVQAQALIELQRGQAQFGEEMGIRTIRERTPLRAATRPEQMLEYLLAWDEAGKERVRELATIYQDVMLHQLALVHAVMEGVRAALAQLDPSDIERGVTAPWPTRGTAMWKELVHRYSLLTEDDKALTAAVFGAAFAHAYAEFGRRQP